MFSLRHTDIHNPISSSSKQISPLATNLFFLFPIWPIKTTAKSLDMTLPANFKFKSTEDPKIIEQLYTLCGTEWGGKLTPEQFGSAQAKGNFKYVDEGGRILSYYIEDANTGTIVATTSVKFCKAFYKPADRSSAISSIPDPSLFGVNNATALLISFVFTHKDYRKLGLAGQCVSKAIEATEKLLIKERWTPVMSLLLIILRRCRLLMEPMKQICNWQTII